MSAPLLAGCGIVHEPSYYIIEAGTWAKMILLSSCHQVDICLGFNFPDEFGHKVKIHRAEVAY